MATLFAIHFNACMPAESNTPFELSQLTDQMLACLLSEWVLFMTTVYVCVIESESKTTLHVGQLAWPMLEYPCLYGSCMNNI